MLNAADYAGPLAVTLSYVGLYYGFIIYILVVKQRLIKAHKARGEKFDRYFNQDRELLAADRLQLNTLEHMPPFLALMWLHAAFVGVSGATIGGVVYLGSRAVYPLMLGKRLGRGVQARVMLATFTGYGVTAYFMIVLGLALLD